MTTRGAFQPQQFWDSEIGEIDVYSEKQIIIIQQQVFKLINIK